MLKHALAAFCIVIVWAILPSCAKQRDTGDQINDVSSPPAAGKPAPDRPIAGPTGELPLEQVRLSEDVSKEEFTGKWGPPLAVTGFGVEYCIYRLADGRQLWLHFASQEPHPLLRAFAQPEGADKQREILFDGMSDTKLR